MFQGIDNKQAMAMAQTMCDNFQAIMTEHHARKTETKETTDVPTEVVVNKNRAAKSTAINLNFYQFLVPLVRIVFLEVFPILDVHHKSLDLLFVYR